MRKLLIKGDIYTFLDDQDFEWASKIKWRIGTWGYVEGKIKRGGKWTTISLHKEILSPPIGYVTDHWNRNKLDNQRHNLRIATRSQNAANAPAWKNNPYGHRGVYFHHGIGKWVAQLTFKGKRMLDKAFKCKTDALLAYSSKAKEIYGEFYDEKVTIPN